MKAEGHRPTGATSALFKLFVIIASTGILATFAFCIASNLRSQAKIRAATIELARVQAALDEYKAHYAAYRPDDPARSPLYFEFKGAVLPNSNN